MAGVLSYFLTLDGGGFNKTIGKALAAVGTLTVGFFSLRTVVERTWEQIERGGQLIDLSNRTGAAVGSLYQLQEAFKVVGIDAGSVGGLIFKLQRSMSGFGDAGENTVQVFAQMGLSIAELQKLNAPQQLERIATALKKLPSNQRAAMSAAIFGREGAANMVQLSRDLDGFNESLGRSAKMAELFDRSAEAFDKLGDTITMNKANFAGLFAGIAERITPILQKLVEVQRFDWLQIGQGIGTFVVAAFKSFENGTFSQLVSDSLRFGFETILDFAPGIFEKVGAMLMNIFATPLTYVQTAMESLIQNLMEWIDKLGSGQGFFGVVSGFTAESFGDILARNKATGPQFDLGTGQFGLTDVTQDSDKRLDESAKAFRKNWATYWEKIKGIAGDDGFIGPVQPKAKEALGGPLGSPYTPERTSWEKLGFVLNGGGPSFDPAQRTATAAEQTAKGIQTIIQKMSTPGGSTLLNAP